MKRSFALLTILLCSVAAFAGDCIPFDKASDHLGSNACVTGKVLQIGRSKGGTTFLDFCEDVKACPFVVVIFARDLRDVGEVRQLEGKVIEVSGKIEEYNGRAEIILKDVKQLRGEAASIPPLPKTYDVEKRGGFSAKSSLPRGKEQSTTTPKRPRDRTTDDDME